MVFVGVLGAGAHYLRI